MQGRASWNAGSGSFPVIRERGFAFSLLVALGVIGIVMFPLCASKGFAYFASAKQYASGISYMDPAYKAIETRAGSWDTVEYWLRTSIGYFKQATEIDPTNVSAYYKRGSVQTQLYQMYRDRASTFEEQGKTEDAKTYRNVANTYLAEGEKIVQGHDEVLAGVCRGPPITLGWSTTSRPTAFRARPLT